MDFSVTQNGKELSKEKYNWDEKTKTFSTTEDNLVIDFGTASNLTFKTGSNCTFNTFNNCTFNTSSNCIFNTGSYCTFNTDWNCTFKTGWNCTFNTGSNCFAIRYGVTGVTEIPNGEIIKFNGYGISGYTVIKEKEVTEVTCEGKIVEIDGKKYKLTKVD